MSAARLRRSAPRTASAATAVEGCVPLMSARPSFGIKRRRRELRAPSTRRVPPITRGSAPTVASPSPIRTSDRCASGARSPLAPTDPRLGTRGCTRRLSSSISRSSVLRLMPENPLASTLARSAIDARTERSGNGSPTPAAWLRRRFSCSAPSASRGIRVSASAPKPVLMPYTASSPLGFAVNDRASGVDSAQLPAVPARPVRSCRRWPEARRARSDSPSRRIMN